MSSGQPKSRTKNIWIPLLLATFLTVGLISGFYLNKLIGNKRDINTVLERTDRLEEIIDLVEDNYVDTIMIDSLYTDAVAGILKHLDPHTTYIPANQFSKVNESLEGNFKGIGIEYHIVDDTAIVSMLTPNAPGIKSGITTGDKLIAVNDSIIAGVGITQTEIVKMIRNQAYPTVKLKLFRPLENKNIEVTINKNKVPINSIDAAYMLDANTGYIRIKRFSANTYAQFMVAIKSLQEQGMSKMVIDLRQNPGGYLDAATEIADEVIGGDKLLVYTQGLKIGREDYYTSKTGTFETGRLVILVDEASASASEILAGAVQDWDRGVIVGRTSYGKGLVQEQFELGDGAALRLTIARYYTPVGRSIQRPYDEGREQYELEHQNGFFNDQKLSSNSTKKPLFYTEEQHRVVYGGGGITPDVSVKVDQYSEALVRLISDPGLDDFIYDYYVKHIAIFKSLKTFKDFDATFSIHPGIDAELKFVANIINPKYSSAIWKNPKELSILHYYIKASLAKIQFNNDGYFQIMNRKDQTLLKGLEIINSDEYSRIINGQVTKPAI